MKPLHIAIALAVFIVIILFIKWRFRTEIDVYDINWNNKSFSYKVIARGQELQSGTFGPPDYKFVNMDYGKYGFQLTSSGDNNYAKLRLFKINNGDSSSQTDVINKIVDFVNKEVKTV